jgi:hypothetical protein
MEHLMPGLAKCPLQGKKYVDIGFDIPTMSMIRNYVRIEN